MTDDPNIKSLKDLREQTEQLVSTAGQENGTAKFDLKEIYKSAPAKTDVDESKGAPPSGGSASGSGQGLTRAAQATPVDSKPDAPKDESKKDAPKPEEKKEDKDEGFWAGAWGGVKGFGKGMWSLAKDTEHLLVNTDTAAVIKASQRGNLQDTGMSFLGSAGKSASELGTAASYVLTNPGKTITGLGSQVSKDWNEGGSGKKGEMVGEGLAFAMTLGLGGALTRGKKWFTGAAELGDVAKAEELARSVSTVSKLGKEATVISSLAEDSKLATSIAGLGDLGKAARTDAFVLNGVKTADDLRALSSAERIANAGKLETTVSLGKDARTLSEITGVGTDLNAASRLTTAPRLPVSDLAAAREGAAAKSLLGDMEAAGGKLSEKVAPFLDGGKGARAATAESAALSEQANAVQKALSEFNGARTAEAQTVAMRQVRSAVEDWNRAVRVNPGTAARATEFEIAPQALADFEKAAAGTARAGEAVTVESFGAKVSGADQAAAKLEPVSQRLGQQLEKGRAATAGLESGEAEAIESKARDVQTSLEKLTAAKSPAGQERALNELRAGARAYNQALEGSSLSKAAVSDLKIADKTLVEAETAAREARAADQMTRLAGESQSFTQPLQNGRVAAQGLEASDAAAIQQKAQEVEQALARARAAESTAARERALADLNSQTRAYNDALEASSLSKAQKAEAKIAESALADVNQAVREGRAVRELDTASVRTALPEQTAIARDTAALTDSGLGAKLGEARVAGDSAVADRAAQLEQSITRYNATVGQQATARAQEIAAAEVRSSIQAYNDAIAASPALRGRAADLQISYGDVVSASMPTAEASRAGAAGADLITSRDPYQRYVLENSALGERPRSAGDISGPLETRLKWPDLTGDRPGLAEAQGRLASAYDQAVNYIFQSGGMVRGLTSERMLGILDPVMKTVGWTLIAADSLYFHVHMIERVARLAREEEARSAQLAASTQGQAVSVQSSGQTADKTAAATGTLSAAAGGSAAGEGSRPATAVQGDPARMGATAAADTSRPTAASSAAAPDATRPATSGQLKDQAPATAEAARRGADLPAKEAAAAKDGHPELQRSASLQAVGAGYGTPAFSPVMQAYGLPRYETPAIAAGAASTSFLSDLKRERKEEEEKKKRLSWTYAYGREHVYLKGAEPQPEEVVQTPPPPVPPIIRRVGGGEGEASRLVTPQFNVSIVEMVKGQLGGRGGEGRLDSPLAAASKVKGKGMGLYDDQGRPRFAFLGSASGDTGLSPGSTTIFKLSGVENSEGKTMGRFSGGAASKGQPVQPGTQEDNQGAVLVAQADPQQTGAVTSPDEE